MMLQLPVALSMYLVADVIFVIMYTFLLGHLLGGIVLDYSVFEVDQRNAGAFGPLPVADITGKQGQLTDLGSLRGLEFRLAKSGLDPNNYGKGLKIGLILMNTYSLG